MVTLPSTLMLMRGMKVRTSLGNATQAHNTHPTALFNVSIRLDVTRKNVLECKLIQQRKTKEGGGESFFIFAV